MRYQQILNEQSEEITLNGIKFPVFINPNRKQLDNMLRQVSHLRGLIKDKVLYVWHPMHAIHDEVSEELGLESPWLELYLFEDRYSTHDSSGFPAKEEAEKLPCITRLYGEPKPKINEKRETVYLDSYIDIYTNPTNREFVALQNKIKKNLEHDDVIRGILNGGDGTLYIWDGWESDHHHMVSSLGLPRNSAVPLYNLYLDNENVNVTPTIISRRSGMPVTSKSMSAEKKFSELYNEKFKRLFGGKPFNLHYNGLPINEKYEKVTVDNGFKNFDVDVWTNPSQIEMLNLMNQVGSFRGIVDAENKNLYLWSSQKCVHSTMKESLGIEKSSIDLYILKEEDNDNFVLECYPTNGHRFTVENIRNNPIFKRLFKDLTYRIGGSVRRAITNENFISRIDHGDINPAPRNFSKSLNVYHHNKDWTHSGLIGKKLPSLYKSKISKGLFGGSIKDTAPYVIPRHITWIQYVNPNTKQSFVVVDKKYENDVKNARPVLSLWNKKNKFTDLPSGEQFSQDPGKPTSKKLIKNPIKYMEDNGYTVIFTDLKKYVDDLKKQGIDFNYEGDLYESSLNESVETTYFGQVWINPTQKEFFNIVNAKPITFLNDEIRIIIDVDDNFYAWKASLATHYEAASEMGISTKYRLIYDYQKNILFYKIDDEFIQDNEEYEQHFNESWITRNQSISRIFAGKKTKYLQTDNENNELKEARIEKITAWGEETLVFINPTYNEYKNLQNNSHYHLRGLMDDNENIYFWPAAKATHLSVAKELGLRKTAYDDNESMVSMEIVVQNHRISLFSLSTSLTAEKLFAIRNFEAIFKDHFNDFLFIFYKESGGAKSYGNLKLDDLAESIEKVSLNNKDIIVHVDPSKQEFFNLCKKGNVRAIIDTEYKIYAWEAKDGVHYSMDAQLGITSLYYLMFIGDDYVHVKNPPDDNLEITKEQFLEIPCILKLFASKSLDADGLFKKSLNERVQVIAVPDYPNMQLFTNPTREQLDFVLQKSRTARGIIKDKTLYMWDGRFAIHYDIERILGLEEPLMELYLYANHFSTHEDADVSGLPCMKRLYKNQLVMERTEKIVSARNEDVLIYLNPEHLLFRRLLEKHEGELRGILDQNNVLYVWDARAAVHDDVIFELGIRQKECFYMSRKEIRVSYRPDNEPVTKEFKDIPAIKNAYGDWPYRLYNAKFKLIEARVEEIEVTMQGQTFDLKVWTNPTQAEFLDILSYINPYHELRGLLDKKNNIYLWDSTAAIHRYVIQALGFTDRDIKGELVLLEHNLTIRYCESPEHDIRNLPCFRRIYGATKYQIYKPAMVKL